MGLEREDGWVMGKEKDNPLPKVGVARNGALINPVQKQILALYLDEYTQRWQAFLRNIRIKTDVLPLDSGSAGMASDFIS